MAVAIRLAVILIVASLLCGCDGTYSGEGCFPSGSRVETARGPMPIEGLKVGDYVLAYDVTSKTTVNAPIDLVIRRRAGRFANIAPASGAPIMVTPDHPLWEVQSGRWVPAGEWRPGMTLLSADGKFGGLTVSTVEISESPEQDVYNIKVRQFENAFVSGVLAHFY